MKKMNHNYKIAYYLESMWKPWQVVLNYVVFIIHRPLLVVLSLSL